MKNLIVILWMISGICVGQNRWVSSSGSDGNSGNKDSPFLSIGKGLIGMGGKDTLYIEAGIYKECADYFSFGLSDRQVILRKFKSTISIIITGTDFSLQAGDPKNNPGASVGLSTELISNPILSTQLCSPKQYYNTRVAVWANKNNCPTGYTGQRVYYYVEANIYSSSISQIDAQQKAIADAAVNKQANANIKGMCIKK